MRGIVYIAFEPGYDTAAALSALAARPLHDLPIHVYSNLKEGHPAWRKVGNVTFSRYPSRDALYGRELKMTLPLHTPFTETLHLDADTLIRDASFVEAFDALSTCEAAFPVHTMVESHERLRTPVYAREIAAYGLQAPLHVYQGGVFVHKRTEAAKRFFANWYEKWLVHRFRDMPPLMAAVHTTDVPIGILPSSMGFRDSTVIQHFYGWKPPKNGVFPPFLKYNPDERTMRWHWDKNLTRWR